MNLVLYQIKQNKREIKNMYKAPGGLTEMSPTVLAAWNSKIRFEIQRQFTEGFGSSLFLADPTVLPGNNPISAVEWSGAPAEPRFCKNTDIAAKMVNYFEDRGRPWFQNEYLEFRQVFGVDESGARRIKRIEFTSELKEYWETLAEHDPDMLQTAATEVIGRTPSFQELYGTDDPHALSPKQRLDRFDQLHVGRTAPPIGALNRENALFMYHGINGLDDLIYVVMFGSKPYEVLDDEGNPRPAELAELFIAKKVEYLACRNADPAAAAGPQRQVWQGRPVSFTPELGMYIRESITQDTFIFNGEPIPDSWLRWSRGHSGMYQHLSLGPADDEPGFLDDAKLLLGGNAVEIDGAYGIAQLLEVGPLVLIGESGEVPSADIERLDLPKEIDPETGNEIIRRTIDCANTDVCEQMEIHHKLYLRETSAARAGTRGRPNG